QGVGSRTPRWRVRYTVTCTGPSLRLEQQYFEVRSWHAPKFKQSGLAGRGRRAWPAHRRVYGALVHLLRLALAQDLPGAIGANDLGCIAERSLQRAGKAGFRQDAGGSRDALRIQQ